MTKFKTMFNKLDVPVLLSIATVVGYGLYYIKATTFNMYYKLPVNFIELKIENLASVIVIVVLAMSLLFTLPEMLRMAIENSTYLKERKQKIKKNIGILLAIVMLTISTLHFFNIIGLNFVVASILILIGVFFRFDKLSPILVVFLFIILGVFLSIKVGDYSAAKKETYLIMEDYNGEDFAVINTYKDMFIIAPVDLKKRLITPRFQFIEMKSNKGKLEFVLKETGQLKVQGLSVNENISKGK